MKQKIFHLIRTQFIAKILGILRELFIFYFFGSSAKFLIYLKYSSFAELTNILFNPQSLITNLLPKLKKLITDDEENIGALKRQAYRISFFAFLLMFIVLDVCYFFILGFKSWTSIGYSLFFATLLSGLFFFNIGHIVNIARGNYKRFNKGIIVSNTTLFAFIIPLSYLTGIAGVLMNRLISVFSHSFYTWSGKGYAQRSAVAEKKPALITFSDFDLSVFVIGNLTYFVVIFLKVVYSIHFHDDIYFFNLASIFIISADALLTKSIATVFIESSPTKKSILKVLGIITVMYGFLYLLTVDAVFFQVNTLLSHYKVKDLSRTNGLFHAYMPMLVTTTLLQLYFNYLRGQKPELSLKLGRRLVAVIGGVLITTLALLPLLHITHFENWFSWTFSGLIMLTLVYVVKE